VRELFVEIYICCYIYCKITECITRFTLYPFSSSAILLFLCKSFCILFVIIDVHLLYNRAMTVIRL
jgi:hypothetical protein